MLRQLACAIAVAGLVAGCSGGDDTSGDQPADGSSGSPEASAGPATPTATPYDPPKLFSALGSVKTAVDKKRSTRDPLAGMWKDTALWVDLTGVHGRKLDGSGGWDVPADGSEVRRTSGSSSSPGGEDSSSPDGESSPGDTESPGTDPSASASASASAGATGNGNGFDTMEATAPVPAKLNGKDVMVVAFYQKALATGTTKDRLQVRFQWIDAAAGEVVGTVDTDITQTIGEDELDAGLEASLTTPVVVDDATGQVAVGVAPASLIGTKAGVFSAYADPATKTGTTVPFLEPAGLSKGLIVGPYGKDHSKRQLAGVDVRTKATKFTGLKDVWYLEASGHGGKHAYLWGEAYDAAKREQHFLYVVDMASGKVTAIRSAHENPLTSVECQSADAKTVVCASSAQERHTSEIMGIDDTTGQKKWGWGGKNAPRVVPRVSTVFHGVVYGRTENGLALLDVLTGKDIPVPSAPTGETPGAGTPGASETPAGEGEETPAGEGEETPGDATSPEATPSVFGDDFEDENPAYTSDGKLVLPQAVSEYGGVAIQDNVRTGPMESGPVAVVLKAIG